MRTLATSAGEYGNRESMATDRFMLQIKNEIRVSQMIDEIKGFDR